MVYESDFPKNLGLGTRVPGAQHGMVISNSYTMPMALERSNSCQNCIRRRTPRQLGREILRQKDSKVGVRQDSPPPLYSYNKGHLVNLSMATNKNRCPQIARGNGPTISSPQTTKGQDRGMVCSACAGWWVFLAWN